MVEVLGSVFGDAVGLGQLLESQGLTLCDRSDKTRVKTAGEENTVRDLGHQPFPYSLFKGLAKTRQVQRGIRDPLLIPPRRLEVPRPLLCQAVVDVSRRESLDLVADGVQALELGSEIGCVGLLRIPTLIKSGDTDGVAGGDGAVEVLVVQHEGEHAVEVLGRVEAIFEVLVPRSAHML